jgi:Icc-related predicted phosphoesterase
MKILLVSDVEDPYLWDSFESDRYRDVDLVISCGDLKPEYLSFLVTMIHAPLLYVPGNHDGCYENNPPEGCENIDGRLITVKGLRILGFGGSHFYNHGPNQYTQKEMNHRVAHLRWSLLRSRGFDILVSHAPAQGVGDANDPCHTGFTAFRELMDRHHPRYFIHGHQHLNYGANRSGLTTYGTTTVINAFRHRILTF